MSTQLTFLLIKGLSMQVTYLLRHIKIVGLRLNMVSELVPQVKPLISVVVPVFNSKNTLQELVHQVFLALGEQCYELVLVDDGSQDD